MSQVEVAYELRNTADYLILSPAEIWDKGFLILKWLNICWLRIMRNKMQ